MVVFNNPRDTSQITHLAKQMYPGKVTFENVTKVPYGYLDLKQETPEQLRLRTSIFPDDGVQYVYISKTYKPRVQYIGETTIENIKEQTPSPDHHYRDVVTHEETRIGSRVAAKTKEQKTSKGYPGTFRQ